MKANTIKIKNKNYKVKYTLRGLFIFEQITGRPFEVKTMFDNYLFFYFIILANNPDNILDWDDFIDAMDDEKDLLNQLNAIITEQQKSQDIFAPESEDGSVKKK